MTGGKLWSIPIWTASAKIGRQPRNPILKVSGMDCGACVAKVEKAVRRLPGISDVQVNLMSETMTLGRTQDGASADVVERQVAALGIPNVSRAISPTSKAVVPTWQMDAEDGCCGHDHAHHLRPP